MDAGAEGTRRARRGAAAARSQRVLLLRKARRGRALDLSELIEGQLLHCREHGVEGDTGERLLLEQGGRGLLDRRPVAIEDRGGPGLGVADEALDLAVDQVQRLRADRAEVLERGAEEHLSAS